MILNSFSSTRITGLIGLLAALLTGAGEFLLHYASLARYGGKSPYEFFVDTSLESISTGHFFAVIGIPLYLIGCWHIYLMLKRANKNLAFVTFLVGSYGFIVGGIWMGSRAFIALIIQSEISEVSEIINFYDAHYESLLQVIRVTTLFMSGSIVWLILKGQTRFPKFMVAIAPIFGILFCFLIFLAIPSIGKYIMPIALNVAFSIFFQVFIFHKISIERTCVRRVHVGIGFLKNWSVMNALMMNWSSMSFN